MGRLSTSWTLVKSSWKVLRQDKELLWMPVLSGVASVLAILAVVGVGFVVTPATYTEGSFDAVGMVLAGLMYVLLAFVAVYFHAATVAAAWERLDGGDPTVGSALRAANRRIGKLFAWSLVVATVNVILQVIREQNGVGRLVAGLVGGAWNLATYFVVPVLMFEDEGVGGGLKRSLRTFRERWGETLVGHVGIGFAMGLLTVGFVLVAGILTVLLASALGMPGAIAGIAVGVLGVVVLLLVSTVLSAVYKAALYRYAVRGDSGGSGFDEQTLAGAAY